jgi:hypothetical protein
MSPRSIAKSDRVPRSAPARLSAASILRVGSESLASVFVLCKDSFFVRLISSVAPADCPAACERADWSVLAPARRVFSRFKIFLSRSYSGLRPVHQGWVRDFRSPQVESSRPGRFRRPRAQVCSAPRFSRRACKASSPIPAPVPSRFFCSVSARLRPGSLLPGFPDSRSLDLFAALDIHLRHRVSVRAVKRAKSGSAAAASRCSRAKDPAAKARPSAQLPAANFRSLPPSVAYSFSRLPCFSSAAGCPEHVVPLLIFLCSFLLSEQQSVSASGFQSIDLGRGDWSSDSCVPPWLLEFRIPVLCLLLVYQNEIHRGNKSCSDEQCLNSARCKFILVICC